MSIRSLLVACVTVSFSSMVFAQSHPVTILAGTVLVPRVGGIQTAPRREEGASVHHAREGARRDA